MSLYRPARNRNDLLCISRPQGWRLVSKRAITTKCSMILHSPTENENANFVMPVWTAGIQFPRMLPETSISAWIPCWNDAIDGTLLEVTEVSLTPIFEGGERGKNFSKILCAL